MSFYISDSETGGLFEIEGTVEDFRQYLQDNWVDTDDDVVNDQEDWDNFCYGAGWTIHDEAKRLTIEGFLG